MNNDLVWGCYHCNTTLGRAGCAKHRDKLEGASEWQSDPIELYRQLGFANEIIATLRAELAAARERLATAEEAAETYKTGMKLNAEEAHHWGCKYAELAVSLATAEADSRRLREALKPFAKQHEEIENEAHEALQVGGYLPIDLPDISIDMWAAAGLTWKHLTDARAAIDAAGGQG